MSSKSNKSFHSGRSTMSGRSGNSAKKNRAANIIQKAFRKMNVTMKQNSAARKIQSLFKRHKQKKKNDQRLDQAESCSPKTTKVSVGSKNLSIFLQKGEKEIQLLHIAVFKPLVHGIPNPAFFKEFYDILLHEFTLSHAHVFVLSKIDDTIQVQMMLSDVFNPSLRKNVNRTQEEFDAIMSIYYKYLHSHFLPYLFHIVANSNIDFDDYPDGFTLEFSHPHNTAEVSGFHKDLSILTCLTYVNSSLSTEIAFDVDMIDLPWFTCSPLLRFESSKKLYTLYFNDDYIHHTVPLWEEEGKGVHMTNPFEEYETFREEGPHLVFGQMQTTNTGVGRDVHHLKNKEILLLPKKEKVGSKGETLPFDSEEYRFLKQHARQKVAAPPVREVLAVFMQEYDRYIYPIVETISMPFSLVEGYVSTNKEERIELTGSSVNSMISSTGLAGLEFKGGRRTRRIMRR